MDLKLYLWVLLKTKTYIMYTTQKIKTYYTFLKTLDTQRQEFLENVSTETINDLTEYLNEYGWVRKGKGGGLNGTIIKNVKFTKKFKGNDVVIEFRCNFNKDFINGLSEFVHDKSLPRSIDVLQMCHFNWNDDPCSSGWKLDVVMNRIETYYSK